MVKQNVIKEKGLQFAIQIVPPARAMQSQNEFGLPMELLRSGTAIDTLVCEAECAESKYDFIHKLPIALKEANENGYFMNSFSKRTKLGFCLSVFSLKR
ncbi:MAG: four helix bundle protein [Saprospiraceae bacterium]|jgi:four helix bundle protein|nr:four helix bundle protein [Saprospiraceae bacterium]MBP9208737.1 four helix bundle protein [Saprospiraceae bacterium]MBV6472297.1 hypothetical protein [Saprospiraceae bacterium]